MNTMLFLYIPAEILSTWVLIIVMAKGKQSPFRLLTLAVIQGLLTFVVRDSLGLIGAHVIILNLSYVALLVWLFRLPLGIACLLRAVGLFLLALGEVIVFQLARQFWGVTFETIIQDNTLHIVVGMLSYFPFVLILVSVGIREIWSRRRGGGAIGSQG